MRPLGGSRYLAMVMGRILTAAKKAIFGTALLGSLLLPGIATAEAPSGAEELVARVVGLTNAERAQAGLGPLSLNLELSASAQGYSEVLSPGNCFGHQCGPLPQLTQRVESAGYTGWSALGENVAAGASTPEQLVAGWMSSPGHRANILNGQFTELGVGIAGGGGRYGLYWTQHFGTRPDQSTLAFEPLVPDEPAPLEWDE